MSVFVITQLTNAPTGDPAGRQVAAAADVRRHGQSADDAQQLHMRVSEHKNDGHGRRPVFDAQTRDDMGGG